MKKGQEQHLVVRRLLFVGYCILMLYLLFVRGRSPVSELPYWEQVRQNYNLEPFRTIRNFWDILARAEYYQMKWNDVAIYRQHAITAAVNLFGNVLLFVPLGYLLPACFQKLRGLFRSMLTALVLLLTVELTQMLTLRGTCDVDDLILNLFGALLGYVFWLIWSFFRCKKK